MLKVNIISRLLGNNVFKNTDYINMDMDTHKDISSKLKFIAKIRQGEKINVRHMYVQQDGVLTKMSRTFYYVDNRYNALNFIEATLRRGFEVIALHAQHSDTSEYDRQICENILKDIEASKEGMVNLKETYIEDCMFCCKIDAFIQDIDARLQDIIKNLNTDKCTK